MHRENHSKELLSLRLPASCAETFWSVSMSAGDRGRGGGEGNVAGTLSKIFFFCGLKCLKGRERKRVCSDKTLEHSDQRVCVCVRAILIASAWPAMLNGRAPFTVAPLFISPLFILLVFSLRLYKPLILPSSVCAVTLFFCPILTSIHHIVELLKWGQ